MLPLADSLSYECRKLHFEGIYAIFGGVEMLSHKVVVILQVWYEANLAQYEANLAPIWPLRCPLRPMRPRPPLVLLASIWANYWQAWKMVSFWPENKFQSLILARTTVANIKLRSVILAVWAHCSRHWLILAKFCLERYCKKSAGALPTRVSPFFQLQRLLFTGCRSNTLMPRNQQSNKQSVLLVLVVHLAWHTY